MTASTRLCSCRVCSAPAPDLLSQLERARLMLGAVPPQHFVDEILHYLVSKHPHGGNGLERALRDAIRMGWSGYHELTLQAAPAND